MSGRHLVFAGAAVSLAIGFAVAPSTGQAALLVSNQADPAPVAVNPPGAASPTADSTVEPPAGVPAGRDVEAAGVSQDIACEGTGGPTVVLLGGMGAAADDIWPDVMPATARKSRVCAVDRAGVGDSPARGKESNGPTENAQEVLAGLQAAGEKGPYLLVGWSYGGLVALTAAQQAQSAADPSQRLAGVVLVDGSLPDEYRTIDPTPWVEGGSDLDMASAEPVIAQLDLGRLPLVVLEAGQALDDDASQAYKDAGMARLAKLSENSTLGVVPDSPHNIADYAPATVVAAINTAVDSARSGDSPIGDCPAQLAAADVKCQQ